MKNLFYMLVFVFFALILQTTLLPSFFTSLGSFLHWKLLIHQTINVAFLILMYICFSRDFFTALFWLFAIVLLQNSFEIPWRGSLALSYILLFVVIYTMEIMIAFQYTLSSMLIIGGLILFQHIFHLLLGSSSMGFDHPYQGEIGRLILSAILQTLAVPFVFFVLYKIDSSTIFYFDKSKSFFGRRVGL